MLRLLLAERPPVTAPPFPQRVFALRLARRRAQTLRQARQVLRLREEMKIKEFWRLWREQTMRSEPETRCFKLPPVPRIAVERCGGSFFASSVARRGHLPP